MSNDVLTTLAKLPTMCASRDLTDGTPILIKRGVSGFYPANPRLDPDDYNLRHGITAIEVEAMESGSCFGWEVPGADPDVIAAMMAKNIGRGIAEFWGDSYNEIHLVRLNLRGSVED